MSRILLVEDEMLIRELAAEELAEAGFGVVCAGSGDEALRLLAADTDFDALISDIRMPGDTDGWQLGRAAKAACPRLAIVYTTGLDDGVEDLADYERCLRKPYLLDEILQAMASLGVRRP